MKKFIFTYNNYFKMKNVIIIHGTGSNSQSYWHPYIKQELEKKGVKVSIPELPNSSYPDVNVIVPYILDTQCFDENTILIGHSSGCPLILSILELIDSRVKKVILVAGFMDTLNSPALKESYDFKKIKENCEEFIFINSVNDPWGCDDTQGRRMFNKLGGTLIINNEGHMGSGKFNQEYREFSLLLKLIE